MLQASLSYRIYSYARRGVMTNTNWMKTLSPASSLREEMSFKLKIFQDNLLNSQIKLYIDNHGE